jgi:putative ABC transport system permease protein
MLIGKGVARALKLEPGDRASVVVSAGGAMNTLDFEVVGVFQSFSNEYDARAIKIPLGAAQELLDVKGVNVLVVSLKRTGDTQRVAQALAADLPREPPLDIRRWEELNDFYAKTVRLYGLLFGVLQWIILAMVLLSVTNTVNMTIFERTGEFGTMRALGNRGKEVFLLLLAENAILGLLGAAIGVAVGVYLASLISAIGIPMPPPPNADLGYTAKIRIVPSVIASAFAVGVIATVLAAILPALRVARTEVVEALRQNV